MTRPDAAKARACAGMRVEKARDRAVLLALRRMPRGYLEARGEFGCNLAGRATFFFVFCTDVPSALWGTGKDNGERDHLPCVA